MQSSGSRAASVSLILALLATTGEAQELAGSFDQLRVLIKSGDTVRVTDSTGQEVRGTISDVSSSSLAIVTEGRQRVFLDRDVAAIRQRRPDSLANGAKWGFVVGASLGALAGITLVGEYGDEASAAIPIFALLYGGLGTGVGAGLDAMTSSDQVIYARRASSSRLTLRTIVTPSRKGILASLAFGGS
jgi:hypothetical protein